MKFKTFLIFFAMFLIIGVFLFFSSSFMTGSTVKTTYTKITTICDDNNLCQKYEVVCQGKKVISKTPITGTEIQHLENWKDLRTKEELKNPCI